MSHKLRRSISFLVIAVLLSLLGQSSAWAAPQIYFYHTDMTGTPQAMTDESGQVVWQADYLPFGEVHSEVSSTANTKQFVGKEHDPETGLSDFGARYLSPELGRFMAADIVRAVDPYSSAINETIVRAPQRQNLYAYGLNNPYRYVDPDGEFAIVGTALAVWGVIEIGLAIYDAVDTAATLASPTASVGEKALAGALFAGSALLPDGGLLGQTDNVAKSIVTKSAGNKVDDVIQETLSSKGNISSKHTLNSDEALDAGLKHLGPGYKEIGKPGSGVFRSADGTRQFRIDNNSLSGNHAPNVPHVHLETYKQGARKPTTNNHIPLVD